MKKCGLMAAAILSSLTALGCLFAGIWIIVEWKYDRHCHVFLVIWDDDDSYTSEYGPDYCNEVAWAVVAFVDFALWAVAAYCLFYFVGSGRYEQAAACSVEEQEEERVAVEMAAVTAIPAPNAPAPFSPTATVATVIYLSPDLEKQV